MSLLNSLILTLNRKSLLRRCLPITRYLCTENELNLNLEIKVPKSDEEYKQLQHVVPANKNVRQIQIAMIGLANVGKSELTNALIQRPISGVSNKAHTTRHQTSYIYSSNGVQLIFLDTPGMVSLLKKQKENYDPQLLMDPMKSFQKADLAMIVVDAYNNWQSTQLPEIIVNLLKSSQKESILVLNKIDLIKEKRKLLSTVESLTGPERRMNFQRVINASDHRVDLEAFFKHTQTKINREAKEEVKELRNYWPHFSKIFMTSATTNDGIDDLRNYLISQAKPCHWKYGALLTNNKPKDIAIDIIRAEYMNVLQKNIPYLLKFNIIHWNFTDEGVLSIFIEVIVPRESLMKFVIGGEGNNINRVKQKATRLLMGIFDCEVELEIMAKTPKKIVV